MPQRVSQASVEIATNSSTPDVRVSQASIEIAAQNTAPNILTSQASAEIATNSSSPETRITQVFASVLVWVRSVHIWSGSVFGGSSFPSGGTVSLDPPPPTPVTILSPFSGGRISGFRPEPREADFVLARLTETAERWAKKMHPVQTRPLGMRGLGSHQEKLAGYTGPARVRKPFLFQNSIVTPAPSAGEVDIVSFEVPEGFYGVITGYGWDYTGTGYVSGSTDIYWRLKIGQRYPKGLGQVVYEVGDPRDPMKTGAAIKLCPRQRVRLIVQVTNDGGLIQIGASHILGAVCGWFYEPYRNFVP